MKRTVSVRGDFFENKLLLQPHLLCNGRNLSSLAPPGGEKKIIFNFIFQNDVTSKRGRFYRIFLAQMKAYKKYYSFIFWSEVI